MTTFPANFNLSLINGSNGFAINGGKDGDKSGYSVSSAGDINGDGFKDIIVGAWQADPNGLSNAGAVSPTIPLPTFSTYLPREIMRQDPNSAAICL